MITEVTNIGELIALLSKFPEDTKLVNSGVDLTTGSFHFDFQGSVTTPVINMLIFCPACHKQHIDRPERGGWDNPPHTSHLCHFCGKVFRLADVPTNGVAVIQTKGTHDTWQNIS